MSSDGAKRKYCEMVAELSHPSLAGEAALSLATTRSPPVSPIPSPAMDGSDEEVMLDA